MSKGLRQKLVKLRKRIGLTQKQLADALGTTRLSITLWETGKATPRFYPWEVRRFLSILNCTLDEFVEAFEELQDISTNESQDNETN